MQQLKSACILFLSLTLLTGIIYPLVLTSLAQLFFSWQAHGSLITLDDKIIGSHWIGQSFGPKFFQGRPSGSNLGPTNPLLIENIKKRITEQQKLNNKLEKVPIDLVTGSASGLDPDISPTAAFYQSARIAKSHHIPEQTLNTLIQECINDPLLGFGEPTVNVLELNSKLFSLIRADHHE